MTWPTPKQWLAVLRRAKGVLAVTWLGTAVVMVLLGLWFKDSFAGMYIAAFSLVTIIVAAGLEIASDTIDSHIVDRELDEFGRKRFAEVNCGFPRPEGINALAKDKPREALRPDVSKSWVVSDLPRQSPESGDAGEDGSTPADGGGVGSVSDG